MKHTSLALAVLLAAGVCAEARAGLFTDNFEMVVVANRAKDAPADDAPGSCLLLNGGYIEAGDPIAGERPPAPDDVLSAIKNALVAQGFRLGGPSPAVAVSCFWGAIRVDHREARVPDAIYSNAKARIELVSSNQTGAELENHILNNKSGAGENADASSPVILAGPTRTTSQLARQPRYFVILTAYDLASIAPGKVPHELWQVKLSAQQTAGGMDEVIPALVGSAGPYLGKRLPQAKIITTSLAAASARPAAATGAADHAPQGALLDAGAVSALLGRERVEYSGTTESSGG
jgi:hypothetical protein